MSYFAYPWKCWSLSWVSQVLDVPVLDLATRLARFSSLSTMCSLASTISLSSRSSSTSSSFPSLSQCFLFGAFLRWPWTTDSMVSTTLSPSHPLPAGRWSPPLSLCWVRFNSAIAGGDGGGEGNGCFRGRPGPLFFTTLFPVRDCLCSFLARRILFTWCRLCLDVGVR